jgi:hypothetical protein
MTTTIQDRMKNKQAEAERRIKALLWAPTPDAEKIAEVALMAGLSGERVAEMEADVEDAKKTLARVGEYNVPELKTAKDKADTAAAKTLAKLETAHEANSTAEAAKRAAEDELAEATNAMGAAVAAIASGRIPTDQIPPELLPFVELGQHRAALEYIEREAAQFRHARNQADSEIAKLETRLEAVKSLPREKSITQGGKLIDATEGIENRLKSLREAVKAGEAHEKALAAKLATAKANVEEARLAAGV